jgi:hypothetical protein
MSCKLLEGKKFIKKNEHNNDINKCTTQEGDYACNDAL